MGKTTSKKPQNYVEISMADSNIPNLEADAVDKLYDKITDFQTSDALKPRSLDDFNLPDYLKKDVVLKDLLENYQSLYQSYDSLLQESIHDYKKYRYQEGYLTNLKETLSKNLFHLHETVDNLKTYDAEIKTRLDLIAPDSSSETELEEHLTTAKELLNAKLKAPLYQIVDIPMIKDQSADQAFFQAKLKAILLSFEKILNANPIELNKTAVTQLIDRLQNHLGKSTNLKTLFNYQQLDHDEIGPLVSGLFEAPEASLRSKIDSKLPFVNKKNNSDILKEKIAATYDALSKIEATNLESISRFYRLKNQETLLETDIETIEKQLKETLDEWIEKLQKERSLFNVNDPRRQDIKGMVDSVVQLIQDLEDLQLDLSEIKRPEPKTLPENTESQERIEALEIKLGSLHEILDHLKKIEADLKLKEKTLQGNYYLLTRTYSDERMQLSRQLTDKIRHTEKALETIHSKSHKTEIERAKSTAKMIIDQSKRQPLAEFKDAADHKLKLLSGYMLEVKDALRKDHLPRFRSVRSMQQLFPIEQIHKANPFRAHLIKLDSKSKEFTHRLKNHMLALEGYEDEKLAFWPNEYRTLSEEAIESLDIRNKDFEIIQEIDARMKKPAYKTSISTMKALDLEFRRIALKRIDAYIAKEPDHRQLRDFKTRLISNRDYEELLAYILLDKIDPRLTTIRSLRRQFELSNEKYINMNLNLLSDKIFHRRIERIILKEMRNDHMEIYSQTKRLKFLQWLRVHVVKPAMQRLTHKNRFFVTPGATHFEKNLVEIGEKAFMKLKPSSESNRLEERRSELNGTYLSF